MGRSKEQDKWIPFLQDGLTPAYCYFLLVSCVVGFFHLFPSLGFSTVSIFSEQQIFFFLFVFNELFTTNIIFFFCRKYTVIVSNDQRQSYKDDFNSEYDEYRSLHARVEKITRRFMQLDAQRKRLSPGSKEYQVRIVLCCDLHVCKKSYLQR